MPLHCQYNRGFALENKQELCTHTMQNATVRGKKQHTDLHSKHCIEMRTIPGKLLFDILR